MFGYIGCLFQLKPQSNQRGIETQFPRPGGSQPQGPQSNQRGIETRHGREGGRDQDLPQSNQRGIETGNGISITAILNLPQSNQRGIETKGQAARRQGGIGLNRTSVGLKRHSARTVQTPQGQPQSNQRGIETLLYGGDVELVVLASIEPAWD